MLSSLISDAVQVYLWVVAPPPSCAAPLRAPALTDPITAAANLSDPGWVLVATVTGYSLSAQQSTTISRLAASTTYAFAVAAVSQDGQIGPTSRLANVTTLPPMLPQPPVRLL